MSAHRSNEESDVSKHKMDEIITHDGREWRVINIGFTREDGLTYYHLASTTEFTGQKNGRLPKQIQVWL